MNHQIPSDDELRAKAREILSVDHTAADEPKLLATFKALHVLWQTQDDGAALEEKAVSPGPQPDYSLPNFTGDVDMFAAYGQEIDAMDFTTDFGTGVAAAAGASKTPRDEEAGGEEFSAQMEFQKIMGMSGTSSPLRRKASERMARHAGFANPVGKGGRR